MTVVNIGGINVELTRKRVRNLNLRVVPPDGRVIVSIPFRMSMASAADFITSKSDWIIKQQSRIKKRVIDSVKTFENGELHHIFGQGYPLQVINSESKEGVSLTNDKIVIHSKFPENREHNEKLADKWYRKNLEENIPALISKWEPIMGVTVDEFRIRKMKTRWGTCNPVARRIWVSLSMAKRRPELLEYIVVHEMVHLIERSHNHRFYSLMESYLPVWKELRRELK